MVGFSGIVATKVSSMIDVARSQGPSSEPRRSRVDRRSATAATVKDHPARGCQSRLPLLLGACMWSRGT
jgi:hypothetical protein